MRHLGPLPARWIIAARYREPPHTVPYVFPPPKRSSNHHSLWKADAGRASLRRAWPKRQRVRSGPACGPVRNLADHPEPPDIREASWTAAAFYRFLAVAPTFGYKNEGLTSETSHFGSHKQPTLRHLLRPFLVWSLEDID